MSPRIKAFLIHSIGSFILAILTLILVFYVWYPSPLQIATGVSHIFLIMLLVDVTIGPLLTLLVYKVGKKSLFFDLTTIVILQLSIFSYGLYTVAIARPVWLVFNVDRFDLVQASDIDTRKLSLAKPEYRKPSWTSPRWVVAHLPTKPEERVQLLFESSKGGYDVPQRPDLYQPLNSGWNLIRSKAYPLAQLNNFNDPKQVTSVLSEWKSADAWLPLRGRTKDMTILINKKQGKIISTVDLHPWH